MTSGECRDLEHLKTEVDHEHLDRCIVCTNSFSDAVRSCVVRCEHNNVCGVCYLRLRSLQRNFSCPSCKTELDTVICAEQAGSQYTEFSFWGEFDLGPIYLYDEKARMFFPRAYFKSHIENLRTIKCNVCHVAKRDTTQLMKHVKKDHDLRMCALCVEHKQAFPSEQKVLFIYLPTILLLQYTPFRNSIHQVYILTDFDTLLTNSILINFNAMLCGTLHSSTSYSYSHNTYIILLFLLYIIPF